MSDAADLGRARSRRAGSRSPAVLRRADRRLPAPHRGAKRRSAHARRRAPARSTRGCGCIPISRASRPPGADERRAREAEAAPRLCGIPIGVKDLYAVEGLPLTASSRVLDADARAPKDSVAWAALRAQGMVLLGHTHTHEFAAGGTTDQVGNPHALDLIAGGSSGGSAAALAARMTPVALGSDTCGSLRIPSACCGTSAIKPTHGRISLDGIVPLAALARPSRPDGAHGGRLRRGARRDGCRNRGGHPPAAAPGRDGRAPARGAQRHESARWRHRRAHRPRNPNSIRRRGGPRVRRGRQGVRASGCARGRAAGAVDVRLGGPELGADDRGRGPITARTPAGTIATASRSRSSSRPRAASPTGRPIWPLRCAGRRERRLWERWFAEHRIDVVLEPTLPILPLERGAGLRARSPGRTRRPADRVHRAVGHDRDAGRRAAGHLVGAACRSPHHAVTRRR